MKWGLRLRRGDAFSRVDRTADEGGVRDGDGGDDVAEGTSEEGFILVAKGIGVLGPRGPVEVEEDVPGRELVRLAPELRLVEESALVVELGEGNGRDDEVRGIEGVEDDVVVGRWGIDEEEVIGQVRGRKIRA